jgi:hypothetical protein
LFLTWAIIEAAILFHVKRYELGGMLFIVFGKANGQVMFHVKPGEPVEKFPSGQ